MNTESNRTEYKQKLTDDLEKEIVAFLNSDGGDLVIGVRDDGSIAGVADTDDVQLRIADRLKNNIRPSIMGLFDVWREMRDGLPVVVVNVAEGMEKPYYIKQKGCSEAGCFLRVGSMTQSMPEDMIHKLLARRPRLSLANMPSRHQNLEFDELKLYYGLKKKPLNGNFAETLDFLTLDGKYNQVATLFADNNNISIRIGKYAGTDKTELISREDFEHCSLVTAMKKVLDRFDIENITQSTKRPMRTRLDKKLVDEAVLHEAIINAFAHNDYSGGDTPIFEIFSDRFVITSYGGLVEGLDEEKFYSGVSKPRNREIMRIFKDLEYVEQLGSGIPKIAEKYGRNVWSISGTIIQTTLLFEEKKVSSKTGKKTTQKGMQIGIQKSGQKGGQKMTPEMTSEKRLKVRLKSGRESRLESGLESRLESRLKSGQKIVRIMADYPEITLPEIAIRLGMARSSIAKQVKKLQAQGLVRHVGPNKGGHWEVLGREPKKPAS